MALYFKLYFIYSMLLQCFADIAVVNPEKISVVPTKTAQTVKTDLPTKFPDETSTKIPLYKTTSITGKIKHSSNVISDLKIVFASTTTSSAFLPTKTIPTVNATKSVCSPAIPLPAINSPCTRLDMRFGAYCKNHGVNLEYYVFKSLEDQQLASLHLIKAQKIWDGLNSPFHVFKKSKECINVFRTVFCNIYFPACDRTGRKTQERKSCEATCDYFKETCKKEMEFYDYLDWKQYINCSTFPKREEGASPECWYYDGKFNETDPSKDFKNDCLYLDGRDYKGNISVTSSGISCQSWTAQCPHRHTMVSTYPELKNASNYCRNPRGSGQQPWCFTSDKNKRWEYCYIQTKCLPVNGDYGNWTLSRRCNSTCGQGIEEWRRYCDAPTPRYGGKNCSSLGSAVKISNCSNLQPCPINGNYGIWMKNAKCNVSCGDGFELWTRKCDTPLPAYGGHNCLELGKAERWDSCRMTPCENRPEETNNLKIGIGAGIGPVLLVILVIFVVLVYRRMKRGYEPYATLHFDS